MTVASTSILDRLIRPRLFVVAIASLLLAACSAGGSGASGSATSSAAASESESVAASASEDASKSADASASEGTTGASYSIEVASSPLGDILTDQDGNTIYRFTPDSENTSTCSGGCAETWPPLALEDGETVSAGDGVTAEIGTMTREDGTTQVTVGGLPAYHFAADAAAGDTNGQGVGGKWFVIGPDGAMNQGS